MSTLVTNKHTPADASGGAIALTLPSSPAAGDEVSVEKVDSSANTVTVTGSIRGVGAQTITLSLYRETVGFRADGSSSWWPIYGHKTLSSLDGRYPSLSAANAESLVRAMVPEWWDNWQRGDRAVTGDTAPSGHPYTRGGTNSLTIASRKWTSATATGSADITYVTLSQAPTFVVSRWKFRNAGSTSGENVVHGACSVGFGSGSIQTQIDRNTAYAFVVTNPITDPYPHLGSDMTMAAPLVDGREYLSAMWWDQANSAITVMFPDGAGAYQFQTITDSRINTYWGNRVGIQLRRPGSGDGYADNVMAYAGPASSGSSSGGRLYGTALRCDGGYAYTVKPSALDLTQDLDMIVYVAPDTWAPGGSTYQCLMSEWATGQQGFDWRINTDGKLRFYYSQDGTTNTNVLSTVIVGGTDASYLWLRMTRTVADGVVTFYTSGDPVGTAPGSVTWTTLGATRSTTAGALFASSANLYLGNFGGTGNPLTGLVKYARVKCGTTVAAEFDPRKAWTGVGTAGNLWVLTGTTEWVADVDTIAGLRTALAALQTQITAIGASSGAFAQAVKSATTTITSSNTLANDADLHLALASTGKYLFEALVEYDGSTTGDFKVGFTVPAGASIAYQGLGAYLSVSSDTASQVCLRTITASASSASFGALGAGTPMMVRIRGIVTMGGTSGTLQCQWAQNVSDATASSVYVNSWLQTQKIA